MKVELWPNNRPFVLKPASLFCLHQGIQNSGGSAQGPLLMRLDVVGHVGMDNGSTGMLAEYDQPMKLLENSSSLFAKLVAEYWSNTHQTVDSFQQASHPN